APVGRGGDAGAPRRHLHRHGHGDPRGGVRRARSGAAEGAGKRLARRRTAGTRGGCPAPGPLHPTGASRRAVAGRGQPRWRRAMSGFDALGFRNRRSVPWASVPRETQDEFRETVLTAVRDGWRLISFFGMPEGST